MRLRSAILRGGPGHGKLVPLWRDEAPAWLHFAPTVALARDTPSVDLADRVLSVYKLDAKTAEAKVPEYNYLTEEEAANSSG